MKEKLIEIYGDVAQMVERSLSMREVRGSIPRISNLYFFLLLIEANYVICLGFR